jgi:hypothetical protein
MTSEGAAGLPSGWTVECKPERGANSDSHDGGVWIHCVKGVTVCRNGETLRKEEVDRAGIETPVLIR